MTKYFNTAFSLSMLPVVDRPGLLYNGPEHEPIQEISVEKAAAWLSDGNYTNIANPNHANTLAAISQLLGVDVATNATGERVQLSNWDQVLVGQLTNLTIPRETREYTDEEIASAGIRFFLVRV